MKERNCRLNLLNTAKTYCCERVTAATAPVVIVLTGGLLSPAPDFLRRDVENIFPTCSMLFLVRPATDVESSGTYGQPPPSDEPAPALKPMQMKVRMLFGLLSFLVHDSGGTRQAAVRFVSTLFGTIDLKKTKNCRLTVGVL